MTERFMAFVVTLDKDMRDDDSEAIIAAISQIRHVLSVKPVVSELANHVAQERVRLELWEKIRKVIFPDWDKNK